MPSLSHLWAIEVVRCSHLLVVFIPVRVDFNHKISFQAVQGDY